MRCPRFRAALCSCPAGTQLAQKGTASAHQTPQQRSCFPPEQRGCPPGSSTPVGAWSTPLCLAGSSAAVVLEASDFWGGARGGDKPLLDIQGYSGCWILNTSSPRAVLVPGDVLLPVATH